MVIQNVKVYQEDKTFQQGEVFVLGEQFSERNIEEGEIIDGAGCYLIPGLIDLHFHGSVGADFCDGSREAIEKIANYQASVGVTSIAPATMTLPMEELIHIMEVAGSYKRVSGAKLVGINMEGPFISPKKKGAHVEEYIQKCNVEAFHKLQTLSGNLIKFVDLAPEEEGAMEFIRELKDEVVLSVAHTGADYALAKKAYEQGASHTTHLYNAMPPFLHREPGVIGAAFDSEGCSVELICDGVHIHPSVVRATFQLFGADRVVLISDSMCAVGLSDDTYSLGGQAVFVKGNRATLLDGTLAGSATNLMDCVRVAVKEMGIPLEDAIASATMNPAKKLGIYQMCGSITPGKYADFVLLNPDLSLKAVYINGQQVA